MSGPPITPKQDAAIIALLTEPTVERAATKAKVAPRTVYRWLNQPEFKAAFRDARRAMVDQAVVVLQQITKDAVKALKRNLTDPAPPGVQVQAANSVLDKAIDSQSLADMQAELEDLREVVRRYADRGKHPAGDGTTPGVGQGDNPGQPAADQPPLPVPVTGVEPRPVAGERSGGQPPPAGDVVLPPGGEELHLGGEDLDALFDPPG